MIGDTQRGGKKTIFVPAGYVGSLRAWDLEEIKVRELRGTMW